MSRQNPYVKAKILRKNLENVQNDLDRACGSTPPPGRAARLHWLAQRAAVEGRWLLALTYFAAAEEELPDDLAQMLSQRHP